MLTRRDMIEDLIMYYDAAGFEADKMEAEFSNMSDDELLLMYNEMLGE